MHRWNLGTIICLAMLLPMATAAEDTDDAEPDSAVSADAVSAREILNTAPRSADLWRLRYPVEFTASTEDWPATISEVDFQESSLSGRMGQLRNLSLVTLLEVGQRRLFLGVNDDGLVGIHFKAFSRRTDSQYLEVVRMPYLSEDEADDDIELPENDSMQSRN